MTKEKISIEDTIEKIQTTYLTTSSLNLLFGGCSILVFSNSKPLIDKLAFYYKDFLGNDGNGHDRIVITAIEAEPPHFNLSFSINKPKEGKKKIKEEYYDFPKYRLVRKKLTNMHYIFGKDLHIAIGPCIKNDNQVVNFINNRFIQWTLHQKSLLGHAAGVVWKGKGLAIAGFSGMGKSSLALKIMNYGVTFLSNDRVMIKKDKSKLKIYGVPKMPRINPGTVLNNSKLSKIISDKERKKFSKLPSEELWDLEYKYDAFIDQCYGKDKFVLSSDLNALVLLNWQRNDSPMLMEKVDITKRRDLLPAFMKSPGLFFKPIPDKPEPDYSEDAYVDYLKHCTVFELRGGVDFEKAAERCFRYLEEGEI